MVNVFQSTLLGTSVVYEKWSLKLFNFFKASNKETKVTSETFLSKTLCEIYTYLTMKMIQDKVFKNGPSKILLGPFLNTLSHLMYSLLTLYNADYLLQYFLILLSAENMFLAVIFIWV